MKKFLALTLVATALSGCHYLGAPEAYTVVEETPAPAPVPAPVMQPVIQPSPMMAPMPATPCGCSYGQSACQINPGVSGPIMITIPASTVCIQ